MAETPGDAARPAPEPEIEDRPRRAPVGEARAVAGDAGRRIEAVPAVQKAVDKPPEASAPARETGPAPHAANGPAPHSADSDGAARPRSPRAPRQDSRRETVLEAAAILFGRKGYDGVSMRDIARRAGMLSGSIYYHFASKDDLFAEVHAIAVGRIQARLDAALAAAAPDPWAQLEAAVRAHLEGLLEGGDGVGVLTPEFPEERGDLARRLAARRDGYEARMRALVAACGPRDAVDARLFRLFLLGAVNWTPVWWRPDGGADLAEVARALTELMRRGAAA